MDARDGDVEPANWARSIASLIQRRAGRIVLVAFVLYGVSVWLATNLSIDQELRRLLPASAPSVSRLEHLAERTGHQSDVYVTIRSPSREANLAFGEALAQRLRDRGEFRYVVFRRDLSYFEDHALLYASLGDLLDLRRRVILHTRDAVRREAFGVLSNPAKGERDTSAARVDLAFDPDEIRAQYGLAEASSEYMEADDGRLMVVKARPARPATDLAYAAGLGDDLRRIIDGLNPTAYHPALSVELNGSYVQHRARVASVQREVWAGAAAAASALVVTLLVYFRSVRAVGLIGIPLLGSVAGALGFAWLAFGVLNIVSAFIFAVLLGLGIDFGIHVLARVREEQAAGRPLEQAIAICLSTTGKTTVFGALSTALAFAALSISDFQGFAQFGQVAAVGVAFAVVGAALVMPALMVLVDRHSPWTARPRVRRAPAQKSRGGGRWRRSWTAVAILGLLVGAWGATQIRTLRMEHDLSKLGRARTAIAGPGRASYRDAVGTYQTVDPAVALTATTAQAAAVQRQVDALLAMTPVEVDRFDPTRPPSRTLRTLPERDRLGLANGEDEDDGFEVDELADPRFVAMETRAEVEALMSPETSAELGRYPNDRLRVIRDRVARAWSVHAFVPRHQSEKLAVLADIRGRLEAKEAWLDDEALRQLKVWRGALAVSTPVTVPDLPLWVRAQFEDGRGNTGRFVILSTRGSKADIRNARTIYAALGELSVGGKEVEVAADFFVIPEIFDAIERDGPQVLTLAFAIMMICAFALLRRIRSAVSVILTVAVALLWLVGVLVAMGWTLNFFNIIVFPLLIGMGQDDALHVAQRQSEHPGPSFGGVRVAAGAIFVTTLTTVFGFSGLLFAQHAGLNSMAWVAVIGMIMALVASLTVLPVLLGRRSDARTPPGSEP